MLKYRPVCRVVSRVPVVGALVVLPHEGYDIYLYEYVRHLSPWACTPISRVSGCFYNSAEILSVDQVIRYLFLY